MTPALVALVLAAAVLHATWNIAAKRADGYGALFVWAYQSLGAVVLAVPSAVIVARDPAALALPVLGAAVVTGLLHVGYGVSLQTGYAKGDLSTVYPVARGTGPLLTIVVAIALLGERPGVAGVCGALVIVAGIVVVTLQRRRPSGTLAACSGDSADTARIRAGLAWGLITGAFIAGYTLWDDHVMGWGNVSPVAYYWLGCVMQTILLAPVALRRRGKLRELTTRRWGTLLAVGLLSPAAYILVLFAMQLAPVSLVAPMRETSVVVGLILARLLFKERSLGFRLVGAVLVVAGVGLIAAG